MAAADLSAAPQPGSAAFIASQNRNNEEKENSNIQRSSASNGHGNGGGTVQMVGGTRVFKKTSPSGYITCYLGKRDFIDHLSHCDPIDGVVLVDPDRIGSDKVFVHVLAAFRYGREDLDVLGLTFRKDLFLNHVQVFPPLPENRRPLTKLQERLMKKLGPNAYPFYFELPHSSPASVTLQPAQNDTGKPCGVDYELKAYAANTADERPHKRNAIRLAIRKLIYAPPDAGPQPSAEQVKELTFPHSGVVRLEATLDRQKYYHGESISINVLVDNNTSKPIKRYKVSIRQYADICLFSTAQYVCPVAILEGEDFIAANQSGWCKVYTLHPILSANRDKRGLALDGKLKHEETNLASSTIMDSAVSKDNLGIIVSYKVKVKLYLAFGAGDIAVELPFILTHPLPASSHGHHGSSSANHSSSTHHSSAAAGSRQSAATTCDRLSFTSSGAKAQQQAASQAIPVRQGSLSMCENGTGGLSAAAMAQSLPAVDHNLIQLEDDPDPVSVHLDDDVIFEDFARMRLQTHAARSGSSVTSAPPIPSVVAPSNIVPAPLFPTPVAMPPLFANNPMLAANPPAPHLPMMAPSSASAAAVAANQRTVFAGIGAFSGLGDPAAAMLNPTATTANNPTATAAATSIFNQFSGLHSGQPAMPVFPVQAQYGIIPPVGGAPAAVPQHLQPFGDSSA